MMEMKDCIDKGYDQKLCFMWNSWDDLMDATARDVIRGNYDLAKAHADKLVEIDENIKKRIVKIWADTTGPEMNRKLHEAGFSKPYVLGTEDARARNKEDIAKQLNKWNETALKKDRENRGKQKSVKDIFGGWQW